eukprot:2872887-Rhodomonas_salina.1
MRMTLLKGRPGLPIRQPLMVQPPTVMAWQSGKKKCSSSVEPILLVSTRGLAESVRKRSDGQTQPP